jgi:hypothetical protein
MRWHILYSLKSTIPLIPYINSMYLKRMHYFYICTYTYSTQSMTLNSILSKHVKPAGLYLGGGEHKISAHMTSGVSTLLERPYQIQFYVLCSETHLWDCNSVPQIYKYGLWQRIFSVPKSRSSSNSVYGNVSVISEYTQHFRYKVANS